MRRVSGFAALALMVLVAACEPAATPTATASASAVASPTVTPTASRSPTPSATASPEPSLALEPPPESDARVVDVTVAPDVDAEGGELLLTVTSAADDRIDELVLRWPAELGAAMTLAPFVPSEERIRDGGPPLVQEWTKWVLGPGEQGEPPGTISLGYGPLLPGATLTIPLAVRRSTSEPVAFDLQVLAGNAILALADGSPAELRVEVP
jgi:hypothetical protein